MLVNELTSIFFLIRTFKLLKYMKLILNNFLKEVIMDLIRRFIKYYKPHTKIFILDMLAAFFVAVIGMCYPIITRYMLNDFIPNQKLDLVIICGISLLVVYLIRMLLRYFIQYYGHLMGVRMQAEMRSDMFRKLERLPFSFYDEHEVGNLMSRMTNDLFDISEVAHHGPENIFIAGFTLLASFVYLCLINWILALIIFACVPLLIIITSHFRKEMRNAMRESKVAMAKINASLESSISGIRVTKAFANTEKEEEKFEVSNESFVKARSSVFNAMGKFFASSQFITDVFNIIVLLAGGIFLYYKYIDFADYSTFIISINMFIQPINQLINFVEQFQNGTTGFKRFLEIMDEEEEYVHEGDKICPKLKGDITFKNVTFNYKTSKEILNDISFTIPHGKKVALVGPSGGGKTTICHLIPRFYDLTQGEILLDNENIKDFTLDSLRKEIGIVQQDVFLFGGTIKENILYGNLQASDEEVIAAAKKANIYDYIMSLPHGFDTDIGERGVKLSGGQKQRLSIARIFLKNPSILILDEATSALDNTTELLIQKAFDELCKDRTSIVVAHRLSTIRNADEIIVISDGQIKEKGTHDELIAQNGAYKLLYDLQFKESDDEEEVKLHQAVEITA